MSTYPEALQNLRTTLEQIRSSRVIGSCFLDQQGRLIQLLEEDPALKAAIIEHYEDRLRQLVRSERAWANAETLLKPASAA